MDMNTMFTVIPGYRVEWFVGGEWSYNPSKYTYPTRLEAKAFIVEHLSGKQAGDVMKNPAKWRIRKVK